MSSRTYWVTRIHLVGDSFTVGYYATAGNAYRDRLLVTLQTLNPHYGSELYDQIAADGAKVSQQVGNLWGVFRPDRDPQVIIFALGQNDSSGTPRTQTQFQGDVQVCFDYVQSTTRAGMIVLAVPRQPGVWQGTTRGAAVDGYDVTLQTEAESRGFFYAPRWDMCLTMPGISQPVDVASGNATTGDGYHPNNFGHSQLHDALWKDIQGVITRAMRRQCSRTQVSYSQAIGRVAA